MINRSSWTGVDVSLPLIFDETLHQNTFIHVDSLALLRIKFFHVLMRILSILWVFIVFLLLHLELPSALCCHHVRAKNLHVVNNKLKSEEGVLFVLTLEVLDWDQHVFNLLQDRVLLVNSFVDHHLIRLIVIKL